MKTSRMVILYACILIFGNKYCLGGLDFFDRIIKEDSVSHCEYLEGMCGTAFFNPQKECLPKNTKGIYFIVHEGTVQYIGSSCDIRDRLKDHEKKDVLQDRDWVYAVIFRNDIRQKQILHCEKYFITSFSPPRNVHKGTPSRPWNSEQIDKLRSFYLHNFPFLKPSAQQSLRHFFEGDTVMNKKESLRVRNLLKAMRYFR